MTYNRLEILNQKTFVIGDMHGDINMVKLYITNDTNVRNCNLIIAGDIGLGFSSMKTHLTEYSSFNKWLAEKGISLYLIRGNHDDPMYFDGGLIDKSNVKTLGDYTVLTIGGTNILCVGGAISIDRSYRLKNHEKRIHYYQEMYKGILNDEEILRLIKKGYWEDEMPRYEEEALNNIKKNGITIDYIITHTSPTFAFKSGTKGIEYWLAIDPKLEEDLVKERTVLTNIYNKVLEDSHPIKEWIYGHFHEHHEDDFNNIHFTALANSDYKWDIKEINRD